MVSVTSVFRSPLLGHWPKVKHNSFRFRHPLHHPIIDDHYFKEKDVQATRAILEDQKEKSDHVDYEVMVYMGTFLFYILR